MPQSISNEHLEAAKLLAEEIELLERLDRPGEEIVELTELAIKIFLIASKFYSPIKQTDKFIDLAGQLFRDVFYTKKDLFKYITKNIAQQVYKYCMAYYLTKEVKNAGK